MSVRMPEPDAEVLGRRDRIVAALRSIVPGEGVIAGEREMRPYETDGLTAYRQLPMVVVLPETTQQVAEDPENRLLARGPRFRLDAEMLRDQALAVSGLLVNRLGGPSVKPPQPEGLWEAVGFIG